MTFADETTRTRFRNKRSGSAILIVMITLLTLSVVLGSVLRFTTSESRLNRRHNAWLDAKLGAEAMAEWGFAELRRRFDTNNAFPEDALLPKTGSNPLSLDSTFKLYFGSALSGASNYASTRMVLPNTYDPMQPWGTYDSEIIAGIVPKGEWVFIDPNVPGNETDKLKNRRVFSRGIVVYAKATVEDPNTGVRETAYCSQELQVRDAPLFSHAIFYNMPMEIAPGPAMEVRGPVHVNGDAYIQSNSGLDFHDAVTIAGNLYHGRHPNSGKTDSSGAVRFVNGSGSLVDMYNGSAWIDNTLSDFDEVASERWHGNLQTAGHHVEAKLMVDMPDYVPDDPATTGTDETENHGHRVVERAKNNTEASYEKQIEEQKYSYKAGLTMKVDTSGGSYSLITYERDADGNIVYDASGNPTEIVLDDSADPIASVELFSSHTSGSDEIVDSGLRDARRSNQAIDVVEVDVGKLRTRVHNNDEADWGGDAATQKPEVWWNGVIYVEFPEGTDPGRTDKVVPSEDGWGLKLTNASQIPNPSFAHTDSIYGMSVATNNVIYVQGHFNADGDPNTGSSTDPDVNDVTQEAPAALIADAINILSSNWDDADSAKSLGSRNAAFTEFSAAIMTGLVPSGDGGSSSYSGGVENFPRFLEDWGGDTLRMRGSVVAMFESEIATEKWGSSGVYSAPNRDWGFHSKLAEGYYPPGTPNTRTYRRIDFKDMAESEYIAAVTQLATDNGITLAP